MSRLNGLGEFGLIELLTRGLPRDASVELGIGDDCAVVRQNDEHLLFSCDAFIEDVHFRRAWASPEDIGWKAAAASISDIAAMGGIARYALVTLACPANTDSDYLERLYAGLREATASAAVSVIGGDTTASPHGLMLSIAVIGTSAGAPVRRSGARPGDLVAVTGRPGSAALGLHALEQGIVEGAASLITAHLRPRPKLPEGQYLGGTTGVTAMIDVSDGLVQDLGHLAEKSGVSIDVDPERLPLSPDQAAYAARAGISATEAALSGGEDYELAFTLSPDRASDIIAEFTRRFTLPLSVIGCVKAGPACVTLNGVPCRRGGYDHFTP